MVPADVVVVGGGCTGTSIAWQLARGGAGRVVLLEREGLAAGATGRSSAVVRQHYVLEPLARMAWHSLRVLEQFADIVGGDAGLRRVGFLALFGPRDTVAVTANVAMQQRVGIETYLLSPDEVRSLEPRLAHEDVTAAAWEPRSGYADPVAVTYGYAAAARRHGADLRVGVTAHRLVTGSQGVEAVETDRETFATRIVVVAAGYRSAALLQPLGVHLPLRPVRHTVAILQRTPAFGPPHPVVSDRICGAYYRPEGNTLTLVGATAAFEGHDDPEVEVDRAPPLDEVETLAQRFCRRFPTQAAAGVRRGYTGVYDCSPDLQPILGPVPGIPGLYVAAGFSGHGFKLSPAVGELLAEQILHGRTTLVDLDLFSVARFAAGRPLRADHPYSVATLG
jgi:sarcosine oxidase subunit beta